MRTSAKSILFLAFLSIFAEAQAQNSAKAKSRDRFREKDNGTNPTVIFNETAANSAESDFAPAFYEDGVVFISNRKGKGIPDPKPGASNLRLWFSAQDPNGKLIPPSPLALEPGAIQTEGPVAFSPDFQKLFYTQQGSPGSKDGARHSKIYLVVKSSQGWTQGKEMPFSGNAYDCMHPSLSADQKRLYFASNMPGGYGGFDIYYADFDGKNWSNAVNAGPVVNSATQEVSPFIAPSGFLLFSSNGHNTIGGYDLFFADPSAQGFQEIWNLNEPFNTPDNETHIVLNPDGKTGFFTSDRSGGLGKNDLFSFRAPKGFQKVSKPEMTPVEIGVADSQTGKPLQGAAIYIQPYSACGFASPDLDLQPVPGHKDALRMHLLPKETERSPGNPDLLTNAAGKAQSEFVRNKSYWVVVTLDGYEVKGTLVEANQAPTKLRFELTHTPINAERRLNPTDTTKQSPIAVNELKSGSVLLLDEIVFERDKATLPYSAVRHLDALFELLQRYPQMDIDLVAHTDTRGEAASNMQLSAARSQNAKTYLIYRGIQAERIQSLGKGETAPRNHCLEGVECTDAEHQQNSRFEVKIRRLGVTRE